MIVARTPLRITLGGGGTDSPEWLREHGGMAITAAIDRYVYVVVNRTFDEGYRLKYSEAEHATTVHEIRHPLFREALARFRVPSGIEIASLADIPAGTGLGSSAAFTVGLCRALAEHQGYRLSRELAAEIAARVELGAAGGAGGVQDHWACALGGAAVLYFRPDGKVHRQKLDVGPLERHLALFYTGVMRDARDVLNAQSTDGLGRILEAGYEALAAIRVGDVRRLGELMHEHWVEKRRRAESISSDEIDALYEIGMENGAIGGKLVGAGGGGFLLFVTEDRERLARALALREVPLRLDYDGSVVL